MGDIELLSSHRIRRSDDMVNDIIFVLKRMGGAAHITMLTSAVEAKLRADRGGGFRATPVDIHATLHAYDIDNADRKKPALFKRPFGPQSHRWALQEAVAHPPHARAAHLAAE